ncbi:MAG: bifunctional diaminohydroxyphosphoribosylaminopyrimidine deaminase/5-amino-6-(5-phosphoribosylamino)uracil reductase RibD [Eubacteriales bacterium]|nr:bifunctional diaminohydroxyphosphoribosylaminopyrimidine deaminase/5-amino-6-(5-phosphoribosylamino)uracil reductase RibD [Eubacteriales bacterium]MDY3332387.1 bifunctional diaminohydroxyphosphoribosylaminopyrimidine deaminase/5-amino-6-(5-phosphoribosylamino)uracil reductase RibD [Gallibacter sp.]
MNTLTTHEKYMQHAISLALLAEGKTSPNPLVGAVIVHNNKIIGKGYHHKAGSLHAEKNAIQNVKDNGYEYLLSKATMYVTLEPCCHHGKTPPCTDAIIEAKIPKVFVGSLDPNPMVCGKGIKILQNTGIEVQTGILENECLNINEIFFNKVLNEKIFVACKYAMTLDGRIATDSGLSKWITNDLSRKYVHKLRNKYDAIMVGIGTVLADNPMLNARGKGYKNPVRIICDSSLKIPIDSQIVDTANDILTIIAYSKNLSLDKNAQQKINELKSKGCILLSINNDDNGIDLNNLITTLQSLELRHKNHFDNKAFFINSIFVEGGGKIHQSLFNANLVDKVYAFIAPKIFGGNQVKNPIVGNGILDPKDAWQLRDTTVKHFGNNILIEGLIQHK